ncbi:hypothetical protein VNO80_06579 [Phaseolus coccineus]|uniref:Uncharacterized protein n=1 Tax=Phaseolus coccineus TaxID=3886 RepID=A0AAN9NI90_PHACN
MISGWWEGAPNNKNVETSSFGGATSSFYDHHYCDDPSLDLDVLTGEWSWSSGPAGFLAFPLPKFTTFLTLLSS